MRICVDTEKCTGHGMCEALAEDVFEVGDDGVVHLLDTDPAEDQRAALQDAVDQCPTQALSLQD